MKRLEPELFDAFFEEVHGVKPFPWQQRLAKLACEGRWPAFVDMPTGAGKTACLDVAVFALARSAAAPEVAAPRRIVMVVDRRVVVDQSHARARKLVNALEAAKAGSVCEQVADALRSLSSLDKPLSAVLLRGAVPRDDNWSTTPDQPLVISSTVDQVGSRLLFRGYGVSPSMWPVHAGLLGSDCLYLLDEVHLARPYFETLTALQALSARLHTPMHRFEVVSLSATPGTTTGSVVRLERSDRQGALAQRLAASKPAKMVSASIDGLPGAICEHAAALVEGGARSVLVVTNRVQRAHDAFAALSRAFEGNTEVRLLTGRMRPIDRDERVREVMRRVASGVARDQGRPLIVVATQCIEAGADFDFDGIVTELASFDALRQRFGRVDRLGEYGKARGVIIEVKEPTEGGRLAVPKDDPVYGDRLVACMKLLKELKPKNGELDFGVDALDARLESAPAELVQRSISEKPNAPPLFPAYIDLWAQTRPAPSREDTPDLGRFLHGPPSAPEVSIVWRGDVEGVSDEQARARIEALPPAASEAVAVPFVKARQWLRGEQPKSDFADVEGRAVVDGRPREPGKRVTAYRWSSSGAERLVGDVRPGETVIVAAQRGGLFHGSFDGAATDAVLDRAEEATLLNRGRVTLRLEHHGLSTLKGRGLTGASSTAIVRLCELLEAQRRTHVVELDGWTLLVGRKRVSPEQPFTEATTDDELSTNTGVAVSLKRHSADVERWAKRFCDALRLSPSESACIRFAAWLHDVGKADPRFQRLLRDGTMESLRLAQKQRPDGSWLLAKSGLGPNDGDKARLARTRSGYPKGARHEVLSASMCDAESVRAEAQRRGVEDFELLLHLVASHHGWCRPFAPASAEDVSGDDVVVQHGALTLHAPAATRLHRLDAGLAERFARLTARYGWHRLAALETIVRLADHRASEEEALAEENADADA